MNQKWIYKLEYKYGHICIPNLMLAVVFGQGIVYVANMFAPALQLYSRLALFWPAVMQGEVWRLITCIFVPANSSPLFVVLMLYFEYIIGKMLEDNWGSFRFNLYYFTGLLGVIAAAALTGYGQTDYLNTSLFWALAVLYPTMQVLLFFIIPVKIKYLALLSGGGVLLLFLFNSWAGRVSIVFSLLNFMLFFGGDFIRTAKQEIKYAKTRSAWRKNQNNYRN